MDLTLVSLIEGTCSLIKEKDLWLLDERSSDSDSLLLAARELIACITYISINSTLSKVVYKVPGIGRLESLYDLLTGCIGFSIEEVFLD